ncbi:hypothetical protein GCM10027299_34220 [Larkinella ripae]
MKKTKFTEAQIVFAFRQANTGVPVAEVCRKMGVSKATYYNWNGAARAEEVRWPGWARTSQASSIGAGPPERRKINN